MILSQKNIEEIAAAVTKDFNVFYFGCDSEESRRMARGTPIDQFAREYLGMAVSFARLSSDGRNGRKTSNPAQEKSDSVGCELYSARTSP